MCLTLIVLFNTTAIHFVLLNSLILELADKPDIQTKPSPDLMPNQTSTTKSVLTVMYHQPTQNVSLILNITLAMN